MRNRGALLLSGSIILVFAIVYRVVFREGPPAGVGLVFCWIPAVYSLFPLLISLLYSEADPDGRSAGFPSHAFLLPVETGLLVLCPMLFAMVSIVLWYWAWVGLVFHPIGMRIPLLWPVVLPAAGMACLQAVSWILGTLPVARILAFTMVAVILGGIGVLASGITGDLGPLIGPGIRTAPLLLVFLAFLGARFGVGRARSGQHPVGFRGVVDLDWKGNSRQRRPFPSPERAQLWFEWKQYGKLFPGYVGLYLIILLFAAATGNFDPGQTILFDMMLVFLCPVLAALFGLSYAGVSFWKGDLQLPVFSGIRPMSSGDLAREKLRMASLSAGAAWALVMIFFPFWMLMTGQFETASTFFINLADKFGHTHTIAACVGIGSALVVLTWILISLSLSLAISGRRWLITAVSLSSTALVLSGFFLGFRLFQDPLLMSPGISRVEWSLVVACVAGVIAVFRVAWRQGHLSGRTMTRILMVLLCVGAFAAALAWEVGRSFGGTWHIIATTVVLLSLASAPMAAAPLALSWNRHR